jgi:hypothetical protein
MSFLEGVPLIEAGSRIKEMSRIKRTAAMKLILKRVSEAYGRMILIRVRSRWVLLLN